MNLHNDPVLANIIVKLTSRNKEDSVSCIVHKLLSSGIIDSSNSLQIKSLLKMQGMLNIRI